jgi:peroxiredoxin
MPTIAQQSHQQQELASAHLPAEVVKIFNANAAELDAQGVPTGASRPGDLLPSADLLDVHGNPTTLDAARSGRPAVIVLYRGDWCPFCNIALRTYEQELLPTLAGRGVALVAITPQKADGALSVQEKNDLTFTVLSDPGNQVARGLGVLTGPPADVAQAQMLLGLDVAAGNADGTDELPMPTVVVVDAAGTIAWIDVHPNYTTRTEVADILEAVANL